jgi:hypothetical protein
MDQQIVVFVKFFFGEDARIERKLFGRLLITTRLGDQVEFVSPEKGFRNYCGGSEIYRSALRMMQHIGGTVTVKGSSDDIIACMAHGRELGITVIPQGKTYHPLHITFVFAGFASIFAWLITCFLGNFIDAIWVGFLVWGGGGFLLYPYFQRAMKRDANRAGQQYRDIFPEVHGSDRRASREAARLRDLL